MRRSYRNASVLIRTRLIRRTDKSRVTYLFSVVGWSRLSKGKVAVFFLWGCSRSFAQRASSPVGPFILSSMLPPCAVPPPQCCPLPNPRPPPPFPPLRLVPRGKPGRGAAPFLRTSIEVGLLSFFFLSRFGFFPILIETFDQIL
jgi:hypothetical protein